MTPDNGGTPLTTYKIWWDNGTGLTTFIELVPSTGLVNTFLINSGLATDSLYKFGVKAVNVIGESLMSVPSSAIRAASVP